MNRGSIPIHFIQISEESVKTALEGQQDILSVENTRAEAIYRHHTNCQNGCGQTMEKSTGGAAFAFSDPNWHIPRCIMKCYACGFALNPFDGMVVAKGDTNKAKYGDVPLINSAD